MNPQLLKVLGVSAVIDVLVGIVVAAIGMANNELTLQVIGVAMLVSGAGVLAIVIVQRNKPTTL